MQLVNGIHSIDRVRGANSYLVITGENAAVVDAGMPGNERRIIDYASSVGVDAKRLRYVILTHPDIDHSGSVAKLKSLTGAKVVIHEADAPRLAGEAKLKEVKGPMGALLGVMGAFMRFEPVKPDVLVKDSDRILDLTVIHTPGHTAGSISLYREDEAIFVGDAMRTDSRGAPHMPSVSMTADMKTARESVRKISTFQYKALLPGHGSPITQDASRIIVDYVRREFAGEQKESR